jgi:hypothetical protein
MHTTDYTPYMVAGTFVALLPFLIHFFSVDLPKAEEQQSSADEQSSTDEQSADEQSPEADEQEPEPEVQSRRIVTHVVSDLEIVILQLLDNLGEMSTRDMLYEFCDIPDWTHVDRSDLNRCLYRMYQESIVSMRKENAKPIWSISY